MTFRKFNPKPFYKAHVYAGLFVAAHFAILSLSGIGLLFEHEWKDAFKPASERTEGRGRERMSAADSARLYGAVIDDARRAHPTDTPLALYPDEGRRDHAVLRLGMDGATKLRDARKTVYDLRGPEVREVTAAGSEGAKKGVFGWLLRLHRELFLGPTGKLYVGLVGAVYVYLLLSGFLLYGRFMRGRGAGEVRRARVPRFLDLHKSLGVVTFGWSLVVGVTGVFLAFNGTLIKLFQLRSLKHLAAKYSDGPGEIPPTGYAPFSEVVTNALSVRPSTALSYVSFPRSEYGIAGHYLVLLKDVSASRERVAELLVMDASTGKLAEIVALPTYLKLVLLSEPLHFGNYGGIALKILWALFAIGSLAVAAFGCFAFIAKRRRAPAPREEGGKIWMSGGRPGYAIPVALAGSSIVGILSALFLSRPYAALGIAVLTVPALYAFSRTAFARSAADRGIRG